MREISLLKSLSDQPYFVKILDVIKDDSHKDKLIYCIFEYCSSTLGKFFAKQNMKPVALEKIQSMMKQLLTAVDIMHGKMILHRDIKPDNILLTKDGNIIFDNSYRHGESGRFWTCQESIIHAEAQVEYHCIALV
jgi:serine/threonine protein kinase